MLQMACPSSDGAFSYGMDQFQTLQKSLSTNTSQGTIPVIVSPDTQQPAVNTPTSSITKPAIPTACEEESFDDFLVQNFDPVKSGVSTVTEHIFIRGPEKWRRTTAVTTVPLGAKIVKISIKDAGAPKAKVDCNFVVKESNPILKAMKAQMKMFMESDAEKCFTEKENFDPESYTEESNKQSRKRPRSQYHN